VHFDLWNGNVFVDFSSNPVRLVGIIDGERAFWGDPLAELASLALFGDIERDAAFLRAYGEEIGQRLVFDAPTRTRVALAQLYLYLIMWIEPAPRKIGLARRVAIRALVGRTLRRVFARLEALVAGG
jgi:aminoglycoside phosphotransferase (APT) family kinase protein